MKSSKKLMIVLLALAIVTALSAGTLAIYTTQIDAASTTVTAKTIFLSPGEGFPTTSSFELAPGQTDETELYSLFNSKDGNASEVAMSLQITPSFGELFTSYPYMTVELCKGNKKDYAVVKSWDAKNTTGAYEADGLWAANAVVEQDYFLKGTWAGDSNDDEFKNEIDNISLSKGSKPTISLSFTASQYIAPTTADVE